jgi:N4-(beta-N-acetylglucosaminyl)-L-asparaginase
MPIFRFGAMGPTRSIPKEYRIVSCNLGVYFSSFVYNVLRISSLSCFSAINPRRDMDRRKFIKAMSIAGSSVAVFDNQYLLAKTRLSDEKIPQSMRNPIILSTWDFKLPVNETGYKILNTGGSLLDAVEKSISLVEEDPRITSVGRGGYPDRDGHLTLDACIMDEHGNAGSVVYLEHIMHPISVARKVMEKTPHVVLAGDGALQFAVEQGFKKEDLLTDQAKAAYKDWLKKSNYAPPIDKNNHDTIGFLAMDAHGNLAGGCSTSGAAWKMHGRVGDSPLIGAGLYVDNEIGAATSTGLGETVIKIAGSFLVVESMRYGKSPGEACRIAVERIIAKQPQYKDVDNFLAGFIAVNKRGDIGAFSYRKGLQYSICTDGTNRVVDADYLMK